MGIIFFKKNICYSGNTQCGQPPRLVLDLLVVEDDRAGGESPGAPVEDGDHGGGQRKVETGSHNKVFK